MDALVHLREKRGAGETTSGEPVLEKSLRGMRYVDNAVVVSHSPEKLRKNMWVIVGVYVAFDLTVSGTKTEIMCLRTKGVRESFAILSVEAAGQVHNQLDELVYLGGNINPNPDLSTKVNRRKPNAWCSFRKYTLELYDRLSAPLELKVQMLRAKALEPMLYDYVVWSLAHVPLRHAAPSPPQFPDSLHRLAKQSHRPSDFLSGNAHKHGKRWHRGDYTREAYVVCGNCGANGGHETANVRDVRRLLGSVGGVRGQEKERRAFPERPRSFRYKRRPEDDYSPGQGGMAQDGGTRGGKFHGEMNRC